MRTLVHTTGTAMAGVVLAAGLSAAVPASAAHAASLKPAAAVCTTEAAAKGWICFLRYCDAYFCYYDCYPTLYARNKGEKPSKSIRLPKPKEGEAPKEITAP
ncbi:hypothetical protein [Sphaerisporangium sp. TRM90804]|uniref:hypothetical protein n=1 Tax=Sphaerisporangium sp. TRM90804 TaxID=3031113 RepID=UPI00244935FE|nr:hypothetical protein [Sphaerisporangium sp. TRM90804]MDH2424964.1 hypothetical protein [Sphaerisporangium sp. TRM90804]